MKEEHKTIMCQGSQWRQLWFGKHLAIEMVKLPRDEWPDKVFKTPLVSEVYRCPTCGRLNKFGDWPGPR